MKRDKRFVVAITGLTGTGKSFFSDCLRKVGANVIDVDVFVHRIYKKGTPLYRKLILKYKDILGDDGEVERKKLREIVFSDKKQYYEFTRIVYPEMKKSLVKELKKVKGLIFLDMAVLFESGFDKYADKIIYIHVDESVWNKRTGRLKNKNYKIIKNFQKIIPESKKIAKSDFIIYNNGSKRALCKKAEEIFSVFNREFYGRR